MWASLFLFLLLFDLLNGNRDEDVVIFISQFVFATVFRPIFISSRILCSFCIWRTHIDINIRYFPITIDLCVSLTLYCCFSSFLLNVFCLSLNFDAAWGTHSSEDTYSASYWTKNQMNEQMESGGCSSSYAALIRFMFRLNMTERKWIFRGNIQSNE